MLRGQLRASGKQQKCGKLGIGGIWRKPRISGWPTQELHGIRETGEIELPTLLEQLVERAHITTLGNRDRIPMIVLHGSND